MSFPRQNRKFRMTLMAVFILCTPAALTSALFYLSVIRRVLVFFTTDDTGSTGPPAAFIYDTPVGSSGPARAVRKRLTWITAVTGQPTLTRPLVTTCENWPFLKATSILCHVENTMKILPLKHPLYLLKTNTPSKIENYTAPLYRNKGRVAL